MLRDVYIDRRTGEISYEAPPNQLEAYRWVRVGTIGDGRDGDPLGMQPASVCLSCGKDLHRHSRQQFLVCPDGHPQGARRFHPRWGGPGQVDLFTVETAGPIPFQYSSRGRQALSRGLTVDIPCQAIGQRKLQAGRTKILTDVWLPRDVKAKWLPPEAWQDAQTEVLMGNELEGLAPIGIAFFRLPENPLPRGEYGSFGTISVCVDLPIRLDWIDRGAV